MSALVGLLQVLTAMGHKKKNPRFNVPRLQQLVHGSPMKRIDREILAKSAVYRAKKAKLYRLKKKVMYTLLFSF